MAINFGTDTLGRDIARLYKALYDAAPGVNGLEALRDQSKVAVGVGSTAAQNVSFYLNDAFKTLSNADWAELIVT
ncbi:hypothetical protein, partial [Inhella gelatinilytica]